MLILDLWGISFHAVVVFGLGKNLLFKSILGRCEGSLQGLKIRGAYSTVVGIMCLPVEIGLTDLPKTGRGAQTHTPDCDSPDFMFNVP